jgi:Helix-turn-helix domain
MLQGRGAKPHFDLDQKCAAVRRVLAGENANRVAAEIQVSRNRLDRWERYFLEGGRNGIARHHDRSRLGNIPWRKLLPWGGLLLLLIATVYAASHFLQAPEP